MEIEVKVLEELVKEKPDKLAVLDVKTKLAKLNYENSDLVHDILPESVQEHMEKAFVYIDALEQELHETGFRLERLRKIDDKRMKDFHMVFERMKQDGVFEKYWYGRKDD